MVAVLHVIQELNYAEIKISVEVDGARPRGPAGPRLGAGKVEE